MNKFFSKKLIFGLAAFFVCLNLFSVSLVMAGPAEEGYGLEKTLTGDAKVLKNQADITLTAGTIIGAALSLVGVLFFALMIYGGLIWMNAKGNEEDIKKARGIIISAVIGLVIVLVAYAITSTIGGLISTAPTS